MFCTGEKTENDRGLLEQDLRKKNTKRGGGVGRRCTKKREEKRSHTTSAKGGEEDTVAKISGMCFAGLWGRKPSNRMGAREGQGGDYLPQGEGKGQRQAEGKREGAQSKSGFWEKMMGTKISPQPGEGGRRGRYFTEKKTRNKR